MLGGPRLAILVALLMIVPALPLTTGTGPTLDPPTELEAPPTPSAQEPAVEEGLLDDLEPVNHVIVRFDSREAMRSLSLAAEGQGPIGPLDGVDVGYTFESVPALYLFADGVAVRTLANLHEVRYIERADKPIDFDLDTATLATLAREVWDPAADNPHVPGNPDPIEVDGETIDGAGVGIAILDSGIDHTHPDLPKDEKVVRSFLATGDGVVEAPYWSPHEPHGTAVAGVAAGTGAASNGELTGAAPGSSLYSFAIHHATLDRVATPIGDAPGGTRSEAITLYPAVAMDWIAENGRDQDPEIRVVNNAWHCRYTECRATVGPDSIHAQLAQELVDEGIAVTWSFGNDLDFTWNPEATLPIQGVIGVTSTDDVEEGIRDGCISDDANVGYPMDPSTWPDVAAPGSQIETTAALNVLRQPSDPDTTRIPGVDEYETLTGSSLSAAHVAGVASMLLQANPDLTPGEVEWILEDTATKPPEVKCATPYNKGDPTHPTSGANYEVGHGLIDAHAAVETAIGFTGIPDTDETALEPNEDFLKDEDRTDIDHVAVEDRFYLTGEDGLTTTRPSADAGRSIEAEANDALTFTSEPFDEARDVSGIDASLWIAIDTEGVQSWDTVTNARIVMTVQRIGPQGVLLDSLTLDSPWSGGLSDRAFERPFVQTIDPAMSFEAGDRLQVEVSVESAGLNGPDTTLTTFELAYDEKMHPSHIGIGHRIPDAPGAYTDCREWAIKECAWMDADHPSAQLDIVHEPIGLEWEGPGGSGAEILWNSVVRDSCQIPADEAWGSCVVRYHNQAASVTDCRVLEQDGPIQGHGTCRRIL